MLVGIIFSAGLVRAIALELIRRRPQLKEDAPQASEELDGMRDAMDRVLGRLDRLEEERDFYKELLDSPGTRREIQAPPAEEASDTGPG